MSLADKIFVSMCEDILENGTDTKGEEVRPRWEDGVPAYTIKKFGVVNRYDLSKEFPALTLRKTPIRSCTEEMLWIWQRKSNNVKDLDSRVWDQWTDILGSIGKAYGYQIGKNNKYKDVTEEKLVRAFGEGKFISVISDVPVSGYPRHVKSYINGDKLAFYYVNADGSGYWEMDQINRVIYDLKNTPYSRRILTNIYNHSDLSEMNLYPCAYSMTFNVTCNKEDEKLVLNGILNQRSQDVLAANSWNVCQYAVLLHMIARECNMEVGEFVHVIADCHIYDRHIPIIEDLIKREQFDAPDFWLNPDIHDFYDFTKNDVRLDNYKYGASVDKFPVAV